MSIDQQRNSVPLHPHASTPQEPPSATTDAYHDTLAFDTTVIEKIIGINAREIPGLLGMKGSFVSDLTDSFITSARPTRGISADINGNDVYVELKTILEYGASGPEVFATLKEKLRTSLYHMTGLTLRDVHMRVVDVMSRDEYEEAGRRDREVQRQNASQPPQPPRY